MQLHLRRSQYEGFWGTIYYCLDAEIDPTPDEAELIGTHGIGALVIFDSEQRRERFEAAQAHAEATKNTKLAHTGSSEDIFLGVLGDLASTIYNLGGAAYNVALGSLSTRITFENLIDSIHIESNNASEIIEAENLIQKAVEVLKIHLESLTTFDDTEQHYEI